MKTPNLAEEKKLWKRGFQYVAGIDEAGRGPLAGPVVAAAVFLPAFAGGRKNRGVNLKINDSKKLSEKQREYFYEKLTTHADVTWGVGVVSEKVIDSINILQATKLAMQKAVDSLEIKPDFLIVDGNFEIKSHILQKPVIAGDQKVFSIAAASIIAKVTRDRIMKKMHKKYPQYGFSKHKGYGTAMHINYLKKFGPCKIHRKTFYPVSDLFTD